MILQTTLIASILLLAACGSNNDIQTGSSTPTVLHACNVSAYGSTATLHSFGDSITFGTGSSDPCNGYQQQISKALNITSDNQGVGGSLLVDLQFNLMMTTTESPQDISTILSGFNDVSTFGGDPTHLAAYKQDLFTAVSHLQQMGSLVVVGTPLRIPAESVASNPYLAGHTDANVALYDQAVKDVVASFNNVNVRLADTSAAYDPNTLGTADGYHPNDAGHKILADVFLGVINQ